MAPEATYEAGEVGAAVVLATLPMEVGAGDELYYDGGKDKKSAGGVHRGRRARNWSWHQVASTNRPMGTVSQSNRRLRSLPVHGIEEHLGARAEPSTPDPALVD